MAAKHRAPDRFALSRAAGFRVSEPLRASPPGMTIAEGMGAASHEAAARLFKGHPHCTMFPCEAVEVMPLSTKGQGEACSAACATNARLAGG